MTTAGIELVIAEPSDLDAVVKTFGQWSYFAEQLTTPNTAGDKVFLARRGEDLLGTVTIGPVGADEAELHASFPPSSTRLLTHLEVPPPIRNQSVGTWIMTAVEDRIRQDGFEQIVLGVDLDNDGAGRLYRRLGYRLWRNEPLKTIRVHYLEDGDSWCVPDECLVFVKDL